MKPRWFFLGTLCSIMLLAPTAGWACGEGIYAMGDGSRHQGYLAPRLATVLVYNDSPVVADRTKAVYRGLVRAGHQVEVARNPAQLSTALHDHRYDVVIAGYDQVGAIVSQAGPAIGPGLLPVLTGQQREGKQWRDRFRHALADDSSLGQYLRLIDQVMKTRTLARE